MGKGDCKICCGKINCVSYGNSCVYGIVLVVVGGKFMVIKLVVVKKVVLKKKFV